MIENVRKFEKDLRGNEKLQKKLFEELAKIAKEKSAESDAEAMAKAAHALGYDFTVADMEKANAETQELDPEEMEQAAGAGASRITTATAPGTKIPPISKAPPASAITTASPCSMIPKWMSSSKKRKSLSIVKT